MIPVSFIGTGHPAAVKLLKPQYHYFLIWGHGLQFQDQILDRIASEKSFEILRVLRLRLRSVKRLVNTIYSYDYAPFHHLKSKTRYLLHTPREVAFAFIRVADPDPDMFGKGSFRHRESQRIKALKEELRNRYNPRMNGKRTEDHVVHASDSESQTEHIIRYLGISSGIAFFKENEMFPFVPNYITCHGGILRKLDPNNLSCRIAEGQRYSYRLKTLPLRESPHFLGLAGDMEVYERYIEAFNGGPLKAYYSVSRFRTLLDSIQSGVEPDPIIINSEMLILDGVHRAAIFLHIGKATCTAFEVDRR